MNFFLDQTTENQPDAIALMSARGALTYRDLSSIVVKTAANFQTAGVKKGDRISFLAESRFEYIVMLFALWRMNAVAIPMNPRIPVPQIVHLLESLRCQTIVLPKLNSTGKIEALNTLFIEDIVAPRADVHFSATDEHLSQDLSQDATIIFTSGTTRFPKAVLHTIGNHYYSALGANENMPFEKSDRWLLSLPIYHVSGLAIVVRAAIGGGTVVMADLKKSIRKTITQFKVTHLSLVPTQLFRMLQDEETREALKQLKAILVGGSEIPKKLLDLSVACKIPIFTTYGLTEMASQVTTTQTNDFSKLYTSGKVLPGREIYLSDTEEILVRGKTCFKGYVSTNELIQPFNENGWFATGDIGSFDNDGYLTVHGRKDNMFISGGENVYPEEIERCISEILGVVNVIVVPVDHIEFGVRPAAFIQAETIHEKALRKSLEVQLPRFKIPDYFFPWPDLPAQDEMKLRREDFKNLAEEKLKEVSL